MRMPARTLILCLIVLMVATVTTAGEADPDKQSCTGLSFDSDVGHDIHMPWGTNWSAIYSSRSCDANHDGIVGPGSTHDWYLRLEYVDSLTELRWVSWVHPDSMIYNIQPVEPAIPPGVATTGWLDLCVDSRRLSLGHPYGLRIATAGECWAQACTGVRWDGTFTVDPIRVTDMGAVMIDDGSHVVDLDWTRSAPEDTFALDELRLVRSIGTPVDFSNLEYGTVLATLHPDSTRFTDTTYDGLGTPYYTLFGYRDDAGLILQSNHASVYRGPECDIVLDGELLGSNAPFDRTLDVVVRDSIAYLAVKSDGVAVVDISDPQAPQLIRTAATPGWGWGVTLWNDLLLVADGSGSLQGMTLFDVSVPDDPQHRADLILDGDIRGVVTDGVWAYAAAGYSGVHVVDVTDPWNPYLVSTIDTPFRAWDVALDGDRLYVADGADGGLQIYDVTNPALPDTLGGIDTPGDARGVDVSGDYAYVADFFSGLQIYDVANPAAPTLCRSVLTTSQGQGVEVVGETLFFAEHFAGLQIFDISEPCIPSLITVVDTPETALKCDYADGRVYVADFTGLEIVDVDCAVSITAAPDAAASPGPRILDARVYPNPFNPSTTLHFELARESLVDVRVYDLAGQLVRELLVESPLPSGGHEVVWDGQDDGGHRQASGVYVYRIGASGQVSTGRMILLK